MASRFDVLATGIGRSLSWQIAPPDIYDSVCVNSKSRLLASVGTCLFPRIRFVWVLPWLLWIELMLGFLGMQRGRGYVPLCCSIKDLCSFVAVGVHNHLDRVGNENGMCPCTYCTCVLDYILFKWGLASEKERQAQCLDRFTLTAERANASMKRFDLFTLTLYCRSLNHHSTPFELG